MHGRLDHLDHRRLYAPALAIVSPNLSCRVVLHRIGWTKFCPTSDFENNLPGGAVRVSDTQCVMYSPALAGEI